MGEKIVIAEYAGFAEPLTESEQNQESLLMIPVGNPTTDTLPNQVMALDVQPFVSFTQDALQKLDSIMTNDFSQITVNDIENQNETFIQRNRAAIDILSVLFCVSLLVFFLVFGIYAHYL